MLTAMLKIRPPLMILRIAQIRVPVYIACSTFQCEVLVNRYNVLPRIMHTCSYTPIMHPCMERRRVARQWCTNRWSLRPNILDFKFDSGAPDLAKRAWTSVQARRREHGPTRVINAFKHFMSVLSGLVTGTTRNGCRFGREFDRVRILIELANPDGGPCARYSKSAFVSIID